MLRHDVYGALARAGGELLETLDAFFAAGGVLESAARALFVHPNTVRYRLQRVAEVTGLSPLDPRDAFALRMALAIGRLDPATSNRRTGSTTERSFSADAGHKYAPWSPSARSL